MRRETPFVKAPRPFKYEPYTHRTFRTPHFSRWVRTSVESRAFMGHAALILWDGAEEPERAQGFHR
jgi:hypothetical protein